MTDDDAAEPYENTLSIEELRVEVRRAWDERAALAKALITLPEIPPLPALRCLTHAAMNNHLSPYKNVDLWAIGKAMQQTLPLDQVRSTLPYKTEYEAAAGLWSLIRHALLPAPSLQDSEV